MGNKKLQTRFGNIKKLGWNPRNISKVAFTNLCESIIRDPDFMVARPIIVDENNDILGGNQRYTALQTIYEDLQIQDTEDENWKELKGGKIPDNWVQKVTGWDDAKKKRFNLIDNSPAGIAGTFDYDILKQEFGLEILSQSGIDFANIMDSDGIEEFQSDKEEQAEKSEMGEMSQKIKDFKNARDLFRKRAHDIAEASHYVVFVFQSNAQKEEFLHKSPKMDVKYGIFGNGVELAEKMGIELTRADVKQVNSLGHIKELRAMTMHPVEEDSKIDK